MKPTTIVPNSVSPTWWRTALKLPCFTWLVLGGSVTTPSLQAATQVIWEETFETDAYTQQWHVEGGEWGVGRPTSGPNKAHPPSQRCVATVLAGSYPASADARFVRDEPFTVHASELCPRLRFWHWNSNWPEDPATVEVRTTGGVWQRVSPTYIWDSHTWTRASLDLGEFAGQTVVLSFHFRSNSDTKVAAGWYVDDVEYIIGCPEVNLINNPEGFEQGLGDWNVDWGQWQVGVPPTTLGPRRAHTGSSCAGTVLEGNYYAYADSRLVSPEFTVPPADEYPRLRFWHWYNTWTEDPSSVEIRPVGGVWQTIGGPYTWASLVWTRPTLDLRAFAGQRVQIAFHFQANGDTKLATGWYVDDVEVATGKPVLPEIEGFESGLGDWNVDGGDWQVGSHPTNLVAPLPKQAFSGRGCAATVLDGDYYARINTRLISPEFEVPSAAEYPRLRFWHWYNTWTEDPASVEIRSAGGAWQTIGGPYTWASFVWTRPTLDLRPFAGQTVQIAFHLQADDDSRTASGWYVDDVEVATGKPVVPEIEGFESGLGDWNVDGGDWQVGSHPTNLVAPLPKQALSGRGCAGTVLDGNYCSRINTRLISPEFKVPSAVDFPRLRFWQWYSTAQGDFGFVEIRVATGHWEPIHSVSYQLNNRAWTRTTLDLTGYAGQPVQLAFHFQANTDANVAAGWYVDDIEVATGRACFNLINNPEGFEQGLGDWDVVSANWQVGKPTNGPPAAFNGIRCAGTVLDGNYDAGLVTRLVSPEFVVPCVESFPRLRFAHWHGFGTGDTGLVEIRELPQGYWQPLSETYAGSSGGGWIPSYAELTGYAGKLVQLAFRLQSNSDNSVGAGWYVDEVRVQANLGEAPPDQQVNEEQLVSFRLTPVCPDLKYRLAPDAPPGAVLDPDLGLFTWKPEACDGPGTYEVKYLLFDPHHDQCPIGAFTNRIVVREINEPPQFGEVRPLPIRAGEFVEFRAADYVYDPNCPKKLTFTLEPGSPTNVTLTPNSGQLFWIPTLEQCGQTNTIVIRVTDDGQPPLSATQTVLAFPQVRFQPVQRVGNELELVAEGASPGLRYELIESPRVPATAGEWTRLDSGTVPAGGVMRVRVPLGSDPARFYQYLLLPPP